MKINKAIYNDVLISLRKIIQSIDLHSRFLVKQFGLTGPQLFILREISKSHEITIGKIAGAVSLGQATVTGILDRLEKRGLVLRQRSEIDRRQMILKITAEGKDLLEKTPPLMQESFLKSFACLQDWEQTMILSSLQRLVSMMDAKAIKAAPILTTEPLGEITNASSANFSPHDITSADFDAQDHTDERPLCLIDKQIQ